MKPEEYAEIKLAMQAASRAFAEMSAYVSEQTAALRRIAEAVEEATDEKVLRLAAQISKQIASGEPYPYLMAESDQGKDAFTAYDEWHARRKPPQHGKWRPFSGQAPDTIQTGVRPAPPDAVCVKCGLPARNWSEWACTEGIHVFSTVQTRVEES